MIIGIFSASFSFYTYYVNHLAVATTLIFTSPIFTCVLAKVFLHENVNRWDIANMISSVFGVMLLYDPFKFTSANHVTTTGVVVGLAAALFVAGNNTIIRKVNATFHPLV